MRDVLIRIQMETSLGVNVMAELLIRSIAAYKKVCLPAWSVTMMSRQRETGFAE